VLIDGFAPGTAEKFGVDYAGLREANPALVHCSINGFGSTGAYAGIKAYEQVVQAESGLFSPGQGGQFGYRPGRSSGTRRYIYLILPASASSCDRAHLIGAAGADPELPQSKSRPR
jgi:hypothetical protein